MEHDREDRNGDERDDQSSGDGAGFFVVVVVLAEALAGFFDEVAGLVVEWGARPGFFAWADVDDAALVIARAIARVFVAGS